MPHAVACFLAQDYPATELVVVDDGSDPVRELVPPDPRIRYIYSAEPQSIGRKRDLGCEISRGEIIVQWDDDDWHGPSRVSHQVAPLLAGRADVTGLDGAVILHAISGTFFRGKRPNDARYMKVIAGTLAFRRDTWSRVGGYLDVWLGEDITFLASVVAGGARLRRLPNNDTFLVVRHGANTWDFAGDDLASIRWRAVPTPACLGPDSLRLYASFLQIDDRPVEKRR